MRRAALHSGTWYSDNRTELGSEIMGLLEKAATETVKNVRAIISPHAGLSYSGFTAAHGFKALSGSMEDVKRVFILGPSHRVAFHELKLSPFESFEGPLGDVEVDTKTGEQLAQKAMELGLKVGYMRKKDDMDEHSIEMQMPFVTHLLKNSKARIVPIVVGSLTDAEVKAYGKLLSPYFEDRNTRFVISSDFCHFGSRFRYTYHYKKKEYPDVGDSVIALDHAAMALMEKQDRNGLRDYFSETQNTICGATPIQILLNSMAAASKPYNLKFVHYSQSNKPASIHDSSVSYASALITEA